MAPFIFFLIEFLDELVFSVSNAAWPLIRTDLTLNYLQIGLILSLPGFLASFMEPVIGVLGDVWKRRVLILGGGVFFAVALTFTATSHSFIPLLLAFIVINPSSGAFVSLSQATLMDSNPSRQEQNMARWTFAGSLGVFIGPLLLSAALALAFDWRAAFWALAALTIPVLLVARKHIPLDGKHHSYIPSIAVVREGFSNAFSALKRGEILRWITLIEFSDLMLDVLYGFLALYFVDVAGLSATQAALAVALWTGSSLLGDFLLIPLLERVRGLEYLRISVMLELLLFPAFLLAQDVWIKLVLLSLMGFFNAGWYAILQGNLYKSMPGQSGTVIALGNVAGLFGKLLPFGIGLAAHAWGLQWAMWLLLAGPLVLLVGLPFKRPYHPEARV
jgi:FSR family fosmidomycin resistance protein-like MFS transporter